MAIRDWPAQERPREKLMQRGAMALSDAELLAIFLRTGVAGKSAVDVARELLGQFGGLGALLGASRAHFCRGLGLGDAKYVQLQAVLEMARRYNEEQLRNAPVLSSATATRQFLSTQLRGERREVFVVLYLDSQHQLIQYEPLFFGTLDAAAVYPREIVRRGLELNAAALIVAHNHPSGVAEASDADQRITRRIREALGLMDMRLLDHCIVAGPVVVSMAEKGLL
ncbi:DNA replication and repair protein RadC [Spongiibacter sp. IMCC21906]|uniref:RadC family protein n=1 Tax=Spongiibacter sp. IMCC21906 TaxID=1620392 RepID=UPI00062DE913|nr:DNA repair protein RadC [Spongiibacter sp. IMCC21906]AKH67980.1 DNA replication and repair protein RadC [Spongiibacter sp. IMCC21906]